ncbi:hypothetical protein QR680_008255 [Steinernema hermaphroditum]|uniref:Uncharacterized protein n=1 Tax=Steinernema hermaphroditum TaxID=289476 RepID=A0AA39M7R0_9BILA|nr:hypothetical protein QR680_008255 [Steinernema hermaphroditum]
MSFFCSPLLMVILTVATALGCVPLSSPYYRTVTKVIPPPKPIVITKYVTQATPTPREPIILKMSALQNGFQFAESSAKVRIALIRLSNLGQVIAKSEFFNFADAGDLKCDTLRKVLTLPGNFCDGNNSLCDRVDELMIEFDGDDAWMPRKIEIDFSKSGRGKFFFNYPSANGEQFGCKKKLAFQWLDGSGGAEDECQRYLKASQPRRNVAYYVIGRYGTRTVLNQEDSGRYMRNQWGKRNRLCLDSDCNTRRPQIKMKVSTTPSHCAYANTNAGVQIAFIRKEDRRIVKQTEFYVLAAPGNLNGWNTHEKSYDMPNNFCDGEYSICERIDELFIYFEGENGYQPKNFIVDFTESGYEKFTFTSPVPPPGDMRCCDPTFSVSRAWLGLSTNTTHYCKGYLDEGRQVAETMFFIIDKNGPQYMLNWPDKDNFTPNTKNPDSESSKDPTTPNAKTPEPSSTPGPEKPPAIQLRIFTENQKCPNAGSTSSVRIALLRKEGDKIISKTDFLDFAISGELQKEEHEKIIDFPIDYCDAENSICDQIDEFMIEFEGTDPWSPLSITVQFGERKPFFVDYPSAWDADHDFCCSRVHAPHWLDGTGVGETECEEYLNSIEQKRPDLAYYVVGNEGLPGNQHLLHAEDAEKYLNNELEDPHRICISHECSLKRPNITMKVTAIHSDCPNAAANDVELKVGFIRKKDGKVTKFSGLVPFAGPGDLNKKRFEKTHSLLPTFCDGPQSFCEEIDETVIFYKGTDAYYPEVLVFNFSENGYETFPLGFHKPEQGDTCCGPLSTVRGSWLAGDGGNQRCSSYLKKEESEPNSAYYVMSRHTKYTLNAGDFEKYLKNELEYPHQGCQMHCDNVVENPVTVIYSENQECEGAGSNNRVNITLIRKLGDKVMTYSRGIEFADPSGLQNFNEQVEPIQDSFCEGEGNLCDQVDELMIAVEGEDAWAPKKIEVEFRGRKSNKFLFEFPALPEGERTCCKGELGLNWLNGKPSGEQCKQYLGASSQVTVFLVGPQGIKYVMTPEDAEKYKADQLSEPHAACLHDSCFSDSESGTVLTTPNAETPEPSSTPGPEKPPGIQLRIFTENQKCPNAGSTSSVRIALLRKEGDKIISKTDFLDFAISGELQKRGTREGTIIDFPIDYCDAENSICDQIDEFMIEFTGVGETECEEYLNSIEQKRPDLAYYVVGNEGLPGNQHLLHAEDAEKYLNNELEDPHRICISHECSLKRPNITMEVTAIHSDCPNAAANDVELKVGFIRKKDGKVTKFSGFIPFAAPGDLTRKEFQKTHSLLPTFCDGSQSVCDHFDQVVIFYKGTDAYHPAEFLFDFARDGYETFPFVFYKPAQGDPCCGPQSEVRGLWLAGDGGNQRCSSYLKKEESEPNSAYYVLDLNTRYTLNAGDFEKYLKNELEYPHQGCQMHCDNVIENPTIALQPMSDSYCDDEASLCEQLDELMIAVEGEDAWAPKKIEVEFRGRKSNKFLFEFPALPEGERTCCKGELGLNWLNGKPSGEQCKQYLGASSQVTVFLVGPQGIKYVMTPEDAEKYKTNGQWEPHAVCLHDGC